MVFGYQRINNFCSKIARWFYWWSCFKTWQGENTRSSNVWLVQYIKFYVFVSSYISLVTSLYGFNWNTRGRVVGDISSLGYGSYRRIFFQWSLILEQFYWRLRLSCWYSLVRYCTVLQIHYARPCCISRYKLIQTRAEGGSRISNTTYTRMWIISNTTCTRMWIIFNTTYTRMVWMVCETVQFCRSILHLIN